MKGPAARITGPVHVIPVTSGTSASELLLQSPEPHPALTRHHASGYAPSGGLCSDPVQGMPLMWFLGVLALSDPSHSTRQPNRR